MRYRMLAYAVLSSLFVCTPILVLAQQTPNEADAEITVKRKDLPAGLLKEIDSKQQLESLQKKIETYGKWVGMGHEVGVAVNESLGALTTQADNFSKTGVGKFTMFIVAYKVLGHDFLAFIIGIPLLVTGTCIFLWSYRRTCLPYRILTKVNVDKSKEYTVINQENLSEKAVRNHFGNTRWSHILIYLLFVGFMLLVMLAG